MESVMATNKKDAKNMHDEKNKCCGGSCDGTSRRDFLTVTASAMGAVGAAAAVWPLVDSMNPAADVLALSSIEQDIFEC
jgi:hypothetical protein